MFKAFHHVAIICSDYSRSKHFYSQILGLHIIAEHYREQRDSYKLDLALSSGEQIELFSFVDAPPRASFPEAQGLRHLAFAVDNIEQVIGYLEQQGVEVEPVRVDPYTNKQFTFFSDPDGLPLELYQQ
ncbi:VOC family protein [Agarivorans sp. 1_MG-2023]|uniref:SMU1112c/YaeR family gloxylase I-like metalloprotein n=1 Tax=Agarivorans sp. 1_MG-2023 TaxID=3062634 RepID=UPI0026E46DB7|nr:VOC family protein [Agarivorans sp. 1_MG-2023]MDO6762499.1 VOC family protein [Agarivorans sp. 1_MG-2023]